MTEIPRADMDAALDALRTVIHLVDPSASAVKRLRVQAAEASVEVEWPEPAAPLPPVPPQDAGPATAAALAAAVALPAAGLPVAVAADPWPVGSTVVRSPMVGTFYRAPEVGASPFVAVGDLVETGQQIAIVEAMKLMNPVHAQSAGRVAQILVDNAASVEYDQELVVLVPVE